MIDDVEQWLLEYGERPEYAEAARIIRELRAELQAWQNQYLDECDGPLDV